MPTDKERQLRDSNIDSEEEAVDPDLGVEAYSPDVDDDMYDS